MPTGSSSRSFPCSYSIMIPADVTGFVIEAMRNTVSLDIGMPLATSCLPNALRYRI